MTKNIIKEITIVLLLTLAIILILGVILYEYVPANKIVPEKMSYITPENVKTELETDTNVDDTEVVITYEIDSTDLSNYKKIQEYVPGRKNPFASTEEETITNTTSTTGTVDTSTQGQTSAGNNTQTTTSQDTGYLPDKGTK